MGDKYLAEDLICSGCQLCGSPLNSELGYGEDQVCFQQFLDQL